MTLEEDEEEIITPELLLKAYRAGIFPMGETRDSKKLYWFMPEERALLPIKDLHVSRSLYKKIMKFPYRITFNSDFEKVINACADTRKTTWINDEIIHLYTELHNRGYAHSVEAWYEDNLVGGLYGVAIGAAFFGESMFSTMADASKISLVYLAARLSGRGFDFLDAQFVNEHLVQFGVYEVPQEEYLKMLERAVDKKTIFDDRHQSSSIAGEASSGAACSSGLAEKEVSGFPTEGFSGATASAFSSEGLVESLLDFSSGLSSTKASSDLEVISFLQAITQTS